LISLDAAMLNRPERQALSNFFRKPFIDESCTLVADRLPHLAQAYRVLARFVQPEDHNDHGEAVSTVVDAGAE
jgi:hypothetical protein